MELVQLKYFLAVAEYQNISQAAKELNVTPSAVSVAISKLEQELGVELFDRIKKSILLNQRGELYKESIQQIFFDLEEANSKVKSIGRNNISGVEINAASPYIWVNVLKAFKDEHPEIPVTLAPLDTGSVATASKNMIESSHADFFIASFEYFANCNVDKEYLLDAPIFAVMSKTHRLAKRKSIDLAELKNDWFINPPSGTTYKAYHDSLCLVSGFVPKSRIACDYAVRPMIILNDPEAVCLCTLLGYESGLYKDCVVVPLHRPVTSRLFAIAWHKNRELSEEALIFKDFLFKYYDRLRH